MMAQPNSGHSLQSHQPTTLTTDVIEDDLNHTSFNICSSFKYIDKTVVSAYEIGIKNGVSANTRSSLASKNGQSVPRADFPVPRERKSLARKPPSGAKLEYKLLGSISKSKSLSEINTINNRGNKILDSNVKRFDNRPSSHNKNTVEGFKSSVNNEGACSVISYHNEGLNKTVISVDNYNSENQDDTDQVVSCDTIKGAGNDQSVCLDTVLFEKEKKIDKLTHVLKHSNINGNKSSFNRRHSLQDGIGLQSSNLVKVDSGEVHRHRLRHGERGKRNSRRRHLSLQTPPTGVHEKSDCAVTEGTATNLTGHESESLQCGNSVIPSRRKLPQVPAKVTLLPKNICEEGDLIDCSINEANDSFPDQGKDSRPNAEGLRSYSSNSDQGTRRIQSFSDECRDISERSGSTNDQSRQCANPSQGRIETNYLKSQQPHLKTKIVSKMADCEISSSETTNIPKPLPSHDVSNITQGVQKGNGERKFNAQYEKTIAENRLDMMKSKKGNASGSVEDKFRKKLKEFVAKGSHKKAEDFTYSNMNNISDMEHVSADTYKSDSIIECAVRVSTEQNTPNFPSLAINSAKSESHVGVLENKICKNDNGSEGDLIVQPTEHELCDRIESSSNSVFNFNQDVIQELTDGVMARPDSRPDSQVTDYSDIQDSISESKENSSSMAYSTASELSVCTDIDKSVEPSSVNSPGEIVETNVNDGKDRTLDHNAKERRNDKDSISVENQCQRLELEGRSYNGKIQVDENNDVKTSAITKNTADIKLKEQVENQKKQSPQKQAHVLRTPSYRKRVMARAKLRYGKKSQNFKECSCVRSDNGDIEKCDFCKNFELKQRSKTSLGHVPLSEYSDSECSEIASPRRALTPELTGRSIGHVQHSPRSVRKVNVSPRVDVLMSSNLFKKHLQKHENLIHKHTMSYKRFGMQKSVSNLDLSEGFTADNESSFRDNASQVSEPPQISDLIDNSNDASSKITETYQVNLSEPTNRRHSLTGESPITFCDIDNRDASRKKSGDTLPTSFAKPRSRPGIGGLFDNVRTKNQNRNYIPSFHEFKRQKEKDSNTNSDMVTEVSDSIDGPSISTIADSDNMSSADTVVDYNLQTVLETDERGSKENLLNSGADETQKQNTVNPKVIVSSAISQQNENKLDKPRRRLQGKSRTLPNIDLSVMSDNSSDHSSNQSDRQKRRFNAKRPRSVISKKSCQDSDTPDTSDKDQTSQQTVSARPKLKGHGKRIIRSESDTKYETEKGRPDNIEELKSKGVHSRHLSLLGKGHNSVSFNLDIPTNDGASERSSSVTESYLSDSNYSESCVNDTVTFTNEGDDITTTSTNQLSATTKDDLATSVLRSTSDACEITQEAARKRRERKERPYKSDPFSGTEILPASKRCAIREEKARLREHLSFASSSREEILSFLDGVSQSDLEHGESFPSLEELSEDEHKSRIEGNDVEDHRGKLGKHPSNVSSLSTDSGVIGQEESHDSKQSSPSNTLTHSMSEQRTNWLKSGHVVKKSFSASCGDLYNMKSHGCQDCSNDGFHRNQTTFICAHCEQRRIERKKIIQEVIDTELNYGRDLNILQEEFYQPMLKAGLLSKDQLDCIFLNLDELIHVNAHFITKLKAAINHSNQHDDEDLQEVMIGSLFLESSTMFLTFENYCVNQAQAPILLEQLEREKELLRIFLHVSQSDNQLLRRMHLKSFLMVPVQRIMKYPLLLDRLYKVTLDRHRDKEALREAKEKIEDILGHINAKSKSSSIKQRKGSEKHYSMTEKIEVSRVALETLGWNRKDVCDVITTRLQITQPLDHMWALKKCKNHKFTTVHGVLLSLLQPNYIGRENDQVTSSAISNASININNNNFNNNNNNKKNMVNNNFTNSINNGIHIQSAAVVLIKEKNGRYQVAREPFMLEKCVVSQDPDYMDVFELLEWNRESYLIKAETPSETKTWVQHLRRQMQDLGYWRKRRNALPNILLNHLS